MAASSTFVSLLRLGLVGLTLAIFVPLMLWTLRSVCGPLERAVGAARRIAGGDLSPLPPVRGSDETAQLLQIGRAHV
jgi:methyl-accepting chemotaxis protein